MIPLTTNDTSETGRATCRWLLLAVAIGSLAAGSSRATEPFYLDLLQQGKAALQQQDYPQAAQSLRIACFGMLDEPRLLAEGLVHLALAQAATSDQDGFLEAYRRLEDLESRFGAYREAALGTTIRSEFEREAAARVESPTLISGEVLGGGETVPAPETVPELTPKQRRSQLKRALRRNADDAEALDALARLELLDGRPRKAGPLLDRLILLEPGNRQARCLRGQAWLQLGQCERAVDDLDFCPYEEESEIPAIEHLQCLVELEEWQRAAGLVGRLPAELADEPTFETLISQISAAGETVAPPGSLRPEAEGEADAEDDAAAATLPTSEEMQELQALRARAASVARPEELAELFHSSLTLSDRHPRWREARFLAAELGYRASRWDDTARLLDETELPDDRPDLLFYLAVSLFEEGRAEEAATALQRALPRLQRTPFVDRYVKKILLDSGGP